MSFAAVEHVTVVQGEVVALAALAAFVALAALAALAGPQIQVECELQYEY